MNTETYKKIAQWAHPDSRIATQLCPATLVTDVVVHGGEYECSIIFNHHEADQRLHLQDKYIQEVIGDDRASYAQKDNRIARAAESAEALLKAIARDILS